MMLIPPLAVGQEKKSATGEEKSPLEKLRSNPNDTEALNAYAGEAIRTAYSMQNGDPQGALIKLDELEAIVGRLSPDASEAKELVATIRRTIERFRENIEANKLPLAEFEKKLLDHPSDPLALKRFETKLTMEVAPLVRGEPQEAQKKLDAGKAVLQKLGEIATDAAVKRQSDEVLRRLGALQRQLDSSKKLTELIGKPAAPLKVEAWINGAPLTDGDLKGKVVLLDFWAVWCGPCIATFPHLREWNEKYSDKGLVIIGLTQYYHFQWDAEAKKAAHASEKVTHDQEQAMLVEFARSHDLKHRFAIQADDSLSDYYGVAGIPHVVVIDQQGIVRMMRIGSGEQNAKDLGELLESLLGGK